MKRVTRKALKLSFAGLLFGMFSHTASAVEPPSQEVDGTSSKESESAVQRGHILNTSTYLFLSTNTARSKYALPASQGSGLSDNPYGTGPRLEVGTIFPLMEMSPEVSFMARIGWFGADINHFRQDVEGTNDETTHFNSTINILKIAPQISYSPIDDMSLDFYFGVAPTGIAGYNGYVNEIQDDQADVSNFGHWGIKGISYQPGFSFRYRILMAGFEMNWSRVTGNFDAPGGEYEETLQYPSYRFYIGINLTQD